MSEHTSGNQEVLRLDGLCKRYNAGQPTETQVLHGLSLRLQRSDFTALTGSSGSGKSTLLNLIGLLDTPTAGELHLLGCHQVVNSSVAVMAAQLIHNIDARVNEQSIGEALKLVAWPARFERVDQAGQTIIIDGAHNPAGMKALRSSLDQYFPAEQRVLLLGILKDKDIDNMLDILLRPNDTVVVTVPHSDRASDPLALARKAAPHVQHVEAVPDNAEALERALELANKEKLMVMAGSLYLVGSERQLLLERRG